MFMEKKDLKGAVAVFYLLIGLEIVIMISPFAAYFYAVYGPLLNLLYRFKATSWLTGFFLPHAVISESGILNFMNMFGRMLFSIGIILFLVSAFQVYSAKLSRRGMVTGVFYRWIRHPQYLFLAISGFGLMLFWSRFIILVLYISMLFIYYLLARHEEEEMLSIYDGDYRNYISRTSMFIPGEPGRWIFQRIFGSVRHRGLAFASCYVGTLLICIALAFMLRNYTISRTSKAFIPSNEIAVISIHPWPQAKMKKVLHAAIEDGGVNAMLSSLKKEGHRGFLVHIMPRDYMMQGLFAVPSNSGSSMHRHFHWGTILHFVFSAFSISHNKMMGEGSAGVVRLVFSQITWPDTAFAKAEDVFHFRVKHLPLFVVDMDTKTNRVLQLVKTPKRNLWGRMPMPLF